jgi:uncharacterized protein (TIGR02001 family)
MDKINKQTKFHIAIVLSSACYSHYICANDQPSLSANIGLVSQYHFRGIQQTDNASASLGLDYEVSGFSVGTWAADVNDGIEIDFYGAYRWDINHHFSFSLGGTSYQYTGNFDSAYNEVNLSLDFSGLTIAYSIGQWDGLANQKNAKKHDYTVLELSYEIQHFTGTFGLHGNDAEGEYFDLHYNFNMGGFDANIGVLFSSKKLDDDESLYFSLSQSIDL